MMCCEVCPRYVACEEEEHLIDLCCVSCSDYRSCYSKDEEKPGDQDEVTDGFENV